uniref:Uncharacterized protein n=1 Tax=Arundo donax TaxID=35708 RepID=A0A0A9GD08_ARUDO
MIVPDDSKEYSNRSTEGRGQLCCHHVSRSIVYVQTTNSSSVLRHLSYLSWTTCAFFSLMKL